jgi:hypothetical protein
MLINGQLIATGALWQFARPVMSIGEVACRGPQLALDWRQYSRGPGAMLGREISATDGHGHT